MMMMSVTANFCYRYCFKHFIYNKCINLIFLKYFVAGKWFVQRVISNRKTDGASYTEIV